MNTDSMKKSLRKNQVTGEWILAFRAAIAFSIFS